MSDFTIEQLKALKEGTPPGPWAAIADYPYISIVIANDIDQIHAPIADIADDATDGPEVDKHHELMAAAPALVDALIAEKRAHQKLRAEIQRLQGSWSEWRPTRGDEFREGYQLARQTLADVLTRTLEADNG